MKQIIVNVKGLSAEEKQRVNEALEKFTGATKLPLINNSAGWFFAPTSPLGAMIVTWGVDYLIEKPTHTPQQILEMAGMSTHRKVRKDFDPKQPISVDVSGCTEEEKKEVQQAFFDVGIKSVKGESILAYPNAKTYSNSTAEGICHGRLLYGSSRTDSISHQQFLSMIYEPERQGHIHAKLMAQYAEDALTHQEPWKLWEMKLHFWVDCHENPTWLAHVEYRRKPKTKLTKLINGVEIPDFQFTPFVGCEFYCANIGLPEFYETGYKGSEDCSFTKRMVERGLIYPFTEEGKQAAIAHSKACLGEGI